MHPGTSQDCNHIEGRGRIFTGGSIEEGTVSTFMWLWVEFNSPLVVRLRSQQLAGLDFSKLEVLPLVLVNRSSPHTV